MMRLQRFKPALPFFLCGALGLGIFLRLDNLSLNNRSPDEDVYRTYASQVVQKGIGGTVEALDRYNADPGLWIYPPPTRVGYIYPLALAMKVTHRQDEKAGVYLSFGLSVLTLMLLAFFAVRFFDFQTAFFALLFMSVSPMDLAAAQHAWAESLMVFLGMMFLWVGFEIARTPKNRFWYFIHAFLGIYCFLVKESGILIFALFSLGAVFQLVFVHKLLRQAVGFIAGCILSLAFAFWVLAELSGGPASLIFSFEQRCQETSDAVYTLIFQGGPWYKIMRALWVLNPFTAALGVLGLLKVFSEIKTEPFKGITGLVLISFILVMELLGSFGNLRYLSPVYALFYLMVGTGVSFIGSRIRRCPGSPSVIQGAFGLLVLFAAFTDYQNFRVMFRDLGLNDLATTRVGWYSVYGSIPALPK
jgi:hypothetical protein